MKPVHKINQQIPLHIEHLSPGGEGVGHHTKVRFFVRDTIPGEDLLVQVTALSQQRPEGYARMIQLKRPSADRVEPVCPHFGTCGGCDLQHVKYEAQVKIKRQQVQQELAQYKTLSAAEVDECQASPENLRYRYVAKWVSRMHLGKVWLGAFARRSHDIISTENCWVHRTSLEVFGVTLRRILNQPVGAVIAPYLRYVVARESTSTRELAVALIVSRRPQHLGALITEITQQTKISSLLIHVNSRGGDSLFDPLGVNEIVHGLPGISESISGCRVVVPLQAFLQINPTQALLLKQKALSYAAPQNRAQVVELYAGVSEMSFLVAQAAPQSTVSSIERSLEAVEAATQLKERLSLSNVSLYQGDAKEIFEKVTKVDLLLLNPPRAGVSAEVLDAIIKAAPQKIVYTSCAPKTFARDADLLVNHGYALQHVTPFDLFPQTAHVEIVASFVLSER
jgi:23S rRNA (uracil1939-C5)-methyltransferase